jgi:deazaflavin-dependent oxidoreductase (nitroreductase family)
MAYIRMTTSYWPPGTKTPFATVLLMQDNTARRLSTLHRLLFRGTSGRVGKRLVNNDMLLLTTAGRRSGQPHTVPLLYLQDGPDLIIIASWGGRPQHPEWYANLIQEPRVTVELPGRRYDAVATPLAEPERSTWWDRAVAAYAGYAEYQSRTDRAIPVVRLTAQR